jgi:hypothetical protein
VNATSFYPWQEIWGIARGGLPAILALILTARASVMLMPKGPPPLEPKDAWRGESLAAFFAVYAIIWSVLLAFDGRYRDIPELDFSVPCAGLSLLILVRLLTSRSTSLALDGLFTAPGFSGSSRRIAMGLLALLLVLCAPLSLIGEGLAVIGDDFVVNHPTFADQVPLILRAMVWNREMDLWAAMQWIMAVPFLAEWLRLRRGGVSERGLDRVGPEPVLAD